MRRKQLSDGKCSILQTNLQCDCCYKRLVSRYELRIIIYYIYIRLNTIQELLWDLETTCFI